MYSSGNVLLPDNIKSDLGKDNNIEFLLKEKLNISKESIARILSFQQKHISKGENISIGDILFLSDKFSEKFKTRVNFLNFLSEKGFPLRLGEQLLISGKLSVNDYEYLLKNMHNSSKSKKNKLFGDELLENNFIEIQELITFLIQHKYKLRVGESLLNMGYINGIELEELLQLQDKKGNNIGLIDLLNSTKRSVFSSLLGKNNLYIDEKTKKDILEMQKIRGKIIEKLDVIENGFIVNNIDMESEKVSRVFGINEKFKKEEDVISDKSSEDIWSGVEYHSVQRIR